MKKYFIKINLRTIKKNPNALGKNEYVDGLPLVRFSSNGFPSFLREGLDYIITEWSLIPEFSKYEGIMQGVITIEQIEEIRKWVSEDPKRYFEVVIERHQIDVTTMPGPEYFYDYLNVKVKCNTCGKYCMSNDLKHDYDDNFYCSSDRVCPSCDEWDCCEIEHETIEQALKRKKKK